MEKCSRDGQSSLREMSLLTPKTFMSYTTGGTEIPRSSSCQDGPLELYTLCHEGVDPY